MADPTDLKIQLNALQIKVAVLDQENERLRQSEKDATAQVSSFMRLIETMKLEASTHLEMITLLQAKIGALEREGERHRSNARHSDERLAVLSEERSALEIRARTAEESYSKLQKQSQDLLVFASTANTELQSFKRRMAAIHEASVATRQSHRRAVDRFKTAFADTLGSFELCSSVLDDMSDLSSSTYRVANEVPPPTSARGVHLTTTHGSASASAGTSASLSVEEFLAAASTAPESKKEVPTGAAAHLDARSLPLVVSAATLPAGTSAASSSAASEGGEDTRATPTKADQPQLSSPTRPIHGLPSPSDTAEALDKLLGREYTSASASVSQAATTAQQQREGKGGSAGNSPSRGNRRAPSPSLERMYSKSAHAAGGTSSSVAAGGQGGVGTFGHRGAVLAHSSRGSPHGVISTHSSPNSTPGKAGGGGVVRSPSPPHMERQGVPGPPQPMASLDKTLEEMGKEEVSRSSSMRVVHRDWKPEASAQDSSSSSGPVMAAGSGARAAKAAGKHAANKH